MKRYAIILSCEEYQDKKIYPDIAYCHEDAYLLNDTLINYCDFAKQNIYSEILDIYHECSPEQILDKIKKMVEDSQEGDTILFYYAGHGDYINNEAYLVLPKTKQKDIVHTALSIRDINKALRKENRINVRIFDCCHSGLDVRGSSSLANNQSSFIESIKNNNDGWFTLASCTAEQVSYPDSKLGHGVFTYYLSEAIEEYAEGEKIIPEILKVRVCDKVEQWCRENEKLQTPTFNASINGNISFAIRQIKEKEQKKENAAEDLNELKAKINLINNSETNNEPKNIDKLKQYIDEIKVSFESNKGIIENYELNLNINEPKNVDDIWDENEVASIVKFLNNKKAITLHEYRIDKQYEEESKYYSFFNVLPKKPKLLSINYSLKQSIEYPESYINMELSGDMFYPSASIFAYVCPLKYTTYIFFGISIYDCVVKQKVIALRAGDVIKDLDKIVKSLFSKFNEVYKEDIEKKIKEYEREIASVNN